MTATHHSGSKKSPDSTDSAGALFERLAGIMRTLRSPEGCPWDREQTLSSLRPFVLEEAYEVLDAIDRDDPEALCGEIGDLIFEGVFLAQLCHEEGQFDIADTLQAIIDKLVRRHPHVFGDEPTVAPSEDADSGERGDLRGRQRKPVSTPAGVKEQWERVKAREREQSGQRQHILAGIPKTLPALLRAYEIGSRVASVGFDWQQPANVVDKIEEEVRELRDAVNDEGPDRTEEEMGDLLFAMVNLARKLGIEPEGALRRANDKFAGRFEAVELGLEARGRSIHDASLDEMEQEWARVKARP